jgi:hypothetical protein
MQSQDHLSPSPRHRSTIRVQSYNLRSMDIFGTTVTSLTLALNVLSAYQAFPGDKKELLASFKYDLWAVGKLSDHFHGQNQGVNNEELTSTIAFLRDFTLVVEDCTRKLQQKGFAGVRHRLMYVRWQADLKGMCEKLFRWSLRLHLS